MITYQEYRKEVFLDQYLNEHKIKENQILEWISSVIDAMEYLYSLNLGLGDFARGSLVVLDGKMIGMFRLQNLYYGLIRLQQENKQYYFEKEVQEIAVLLYQLCTGEVPILPIGMIRNDSLDRNFVNKVNLIIQKSTRENNQIKYNSFAQMRKDLYLNRISVRDIMFLRKRLAKLTRYEKIKETNIDKVFMGDGEIDVRNDSLEEKFGFDGTVVVSDDENNELCAANIEILICSTLEVFKSSKNEIMIGTNKEKCDLALKQPSVSQSNTKLRRGENNDYYIIDLDSTNGTYLMSSGKKIQSGEFVPISKGEIFKIGNGIMLKLL